MPKTKFQEVIFTIMMVVVMVYALVVYNIALDKGRLTNEVFVIALGELVIMGIIGFVLEMLIAGPLSQRLAFRIVTPGVDKPVLVILAISSMTVCLMCPMMSFAATVLFKGVNAQLFSNWVQTSVLNFPMAMFWQIFCAGPLVRLIFGRLFAEKNVMMAAREAE